MKRHLCATALFAVLLIPDWASACWPRWGGPVYSRAYYAPVYRPLAWGAACYPAQPVYCEPAYVRPVYVHPAAPVVPAPMNPPRVERTGTTEPVRPIAKPTPAPADVDPVRPAAGTDTPKPQPPRPEPPRPEPKREPAEGPKIPEPKIPPLEIPKVGGSDAKVPPLELLKPGGEPKLPPLELPKGGPDPKLPTIEPPKGDDAKPMVPAAPGGPAVPAPAPAPDLIPPPNVPAPKNPDALPPLTLPPDSPIMPATPVEAKSSPLATAGRELRVSVFPAAGAAAAAGTGLRKVGFFNHTKRDLALVIEGKAVTLPAMSYLHAQLPTTFTWKCADRPAVSEAVPAGAAGVDVLIRE